MIGQQIEVLSRGRTEQEQRVLTTEALDFLQGLQTAFGGARRELLERRAERQRRLDAGEMPTFLPDTAAIRSADWSVAPAPAELERRVCEITGPAERKMMINALNSGATGFMADLEDSLSPTWSNLVTGQANLIDAVDERISLHTPDRDYRLGANPARLFVRPRGWHMEEGHVVLAGEAMSASLFDVGLYLFHCAPRLSARGHGVYLYLPKLQSHLEARLWDRVLGECEVQLGLARGSIRATVLIEHVLAAFEMDEILYELRDHSAGLNAGRWDYIFSAIKSYREMPQMMLPDRADVSMTVPFMRAYTRLLVRTCHRRGAHAIGGMSAYIPSRRDAEANQRALAAVGADKHREATDGFDGTWVAHPDLVEPATREFDAVLGGRRNQLDQPGEPEPSAAQLLSIGETPGERTEQGLAQNIAVALEYLANWLGGRGAVAINSLMEDAATAEISRSQVWQWVRHGARLSGGDTVDADLARRLLTEAAERLRRAQGEQLGPDRIEAARELLERTSLSPDFVEFLTVAAYPQLDQEVWHG